MKSVLQLKGSGGGGCFAGGTHILTPTGSVLIEHIKVGDIVVCFDADLNFYHRKVTEVFVHEDEPIWKYVFWGGAFVYSTPVHCFLNQNNEFREIGLFDTQDFVRNTKRNLLPFMEGHFVASGPVYNLHVEEFHTFVANDVLVHNGGGGGKGGGGGGSAYSEAANTAQSSVIARLLEVTSVGEVVGLVDGAKSIYLDETPVQNDDGSYNFTGVNWQQRQGTEHQEVIEGFEDIREEFNIGAEVIKAMPITRRIDTLGIDALVIKIQAPAGLSYLNTGANRLEGSSFTLTFDISYDEGVFERITTATITEKTTSAYERSYYFPIRVSTSAVVRITRTTEDAETSNIQNSSSWAGYTTLSGYKLNYPNVALMGYTVDAREFGSNLPLRYVHMKGIIVDVPANYDPDKRSYSGLWDGTFKRAYTNNPAWLVWWILTDKINGIGRDIPEWALEETKIDLYEIARYNDEPVPNGFGGHEPRFTFNAWIVERQNAFDLLQLICGTMNALIFWDGNTIKISQDSPKDIERVFGDANVIDGIFTYEQIPLSTMHSVALVTYNDMTDFGKARVEVVEDVEMIHKLGNKPLDITVLGCTSRGQARRAGGFHIYTEKFENETVTFKVGLADCTAQVGDIIGIADTKRQGVNYQGRVKQIDDNILTLDREVIYNPAAEYHVLLVLADGTVQKIEIENQQEASNTVILLEETRAPIVLGAQWLLVSTELVPSEWRILGISEEEPTVFGISALKYDRRKYDYIEYGFTFPEPPTSLVPTGKLPSPYDLHFDEYLYAQTGGAILSAGIFSWTEPQDARIRYFNIRIKSTSLDLYTDLPTTSLSSTTITDLLQGAYQIEVRSVSNLGLTSAWAILQVKVLGVNLPLDDVTGLTDVYKENRQLHLTWEPITDPRDFHYEIRTGSFTWETAYTIGTTKNTFYPIQGENFYLVKAVFQQAESINPAVLEIEDISGSGIVANVIATIDERKHNWEGITNEEFRIDPENGNMYLDTSLNNAWTIEDAWAIQDVWSFDYTGETAYYTHLPKRDILLSANNTPTISFLCSYYGTSRHKNAWAIEDAWAIQDAWGAVNAGVSVERQIQVRKNGVWGEWKIYIDTMDYVGDGYRFRIKVSSAKEVLLYINEFKVSVDVPDNVQRFTGLTIPVEGLYLQFTPEYNTIPNIQGTLIGVTGNEDFYYIDSELDTKGVRVYVHDKQRNPIEWNANVISVGY